MIPHWLWIIALLHIVSSSQLTIAEIQATGRVLFRALRDSDCKIKCSNRQRRPVCGSDGITYASRCDLVKAKRCDQRKITISKRGNCSGSKNSTKCQQERVEAQKIARRPTAGIFVPECKKDGSYVEVQCHAATNYCWCVTKEGRPITGTSLHGKKPSCKGKSRHKKSFRNDGLKKKRGCRKTDRIEFNNNLLQTFIKEYERAKSSGDLSLTGNNDDNHEKRVAEWKFSQLDKNKDNKLRRKEVRALKRMVKKVIKPRSCAKTFISYCDFDQNKRIEPREWTSCLGVYTNGKQGRPRQDTNQIQNIFIDSKKIGPPKGLIPHQPSKTPPQDTDDKKPSCIEEREAALRQNIQDPNGGTFITSCTTDGLWSRIQCHNASGFCWCVDQSTGAPISGTSILKQIPDCNAVKIQRQMKGCPFSKKRRFLSDLFAYIIQQMNSSSTLHVYSKDAVKQPLEAAAEWKFKSLDKNSNNVLERKELKVLRKEMPQTKDTRRCRRNFIRYCDENKDRKVSQKEWTTCMDSTTSTTLLPEDNRRVGPNPFSTILRGS